MTASFLLRTCQAAGLVVLVSAAGAGLARAQSPGAEAVLTEFPANALALSAADIDERLRGQTYTGTTATGVPWRADYKASGYVFVDMANGARDSGAWRAEEGRVCVEYRGRFPSGCTELRASPDTLYGKRENASDVTRMRKQ